MIKALAILHLYPSATESDFRVEDRGEGQVIVHWGLPDPQPTQEQLEAAWAAVQAKQAQKDAFWNARLAMAEEFHKLNVDVRAWHTGDYAAVEASIIRGDIAAAKRRIETMTICPAVPEAEREPLRQQFLAFFPS